MARAAGERCVSPQPATEPPPREHPFSSPSHPPCLPPPLPQYDQGTSTYSPDGKLYQVDYAYKALESSGTAVGVRCKDGIVFGVEKLLASKMLVAGSGRRIHTVDEHVGAVRGADKRGGQTGGRGAPFSVRPRESPIRGEALVKGSRCRVLEPACHALLHRPTSSLSPLYTPRLWLA